MLQQVQKNRRTEMVTVNVGTNNAAGFFNFGQLPNIRTATQIIRIEAYDVTQTPLTPDGKTVISANALKNSYLRLIARDGNSAEVRMIPLWDINQNTSNLDVKDINCQGIDWEKSQIISTNPATVNANESYLFKVEYLRPEAN